MWAGSDRKQLSSLVRTDGVTSVVNSADSSADFIRGSAIGDLHLERPHPVSWSATTRPSSFKRHRNRDSWIGMILASTIFTQSEQGISWACLWTLKPLPHPVMAVR
jgi:hypothetical protein